MRVGRSVVSVVGRGCLVAIFLLSGLGDKLPKYASTQEKMKAAGVPAPAVLLPGAIVFLVVGGALVLVGYHAQLGAALLATFLVLATWYFHAFWNISDPLEKRTHLVQALKNLGLFGAMLMVMANGAGSGCVDRLLARRRPPDPDITDG